MVHHSVFGFNTGPSGAPNRLHRDQIPDIQLSACLSLATAPYGDVETSTRIAEGPTLLPDEEGPVTGIGSKLHDSHMSKVSSAGWIC